MHLHPRHRLAYPRPDGRPWIATGTHPGGNEGESLSLTDPREPAPSPEEVGRGALPEELGRFRAIRIAAQTAVLEYRLGTTAVAEWTTANGDSENPVVTRNFEVGVSQRALRIILGVKAPGTFVSLGLPDGTTAAAARIVEEKGVTTLLLAPRERPLRFSVAFTNGGATAPNVRGGVGPPNDRVRRWPSGIRWGWVRCHPVVQTYCHGWTPDCFEYFGQTTRGLNK